MNTSTNCDEWSAKVQDYMIEYSWKWTVKDGVFKYEMIRNSLLLLLLCSKCFTEVFDTATAYYIKCLVINYTKWQYIAQIGSDWVCPVRGCDFNKRPPSINSVVVVI